MMIFVFLDTCLLHDVLIFREKFHVRHTQGGFYNRPWMIQTTGVPGWLCGDESTNL